MKISCSVYVNNNEIVPVLIPCKYLCHDAQIYWYRFVLICTFLKQITFYIFNLWHLDHATRLKNYHTIIHRKHFSSSWLDQSKRHSMNVNIVLMYLSCFKLSYLFNHFVKMMQNPFTILIRKKLKYSRRQNYLNMQNRNLNLPV